MDPLQRRRELNHMAYQHVLRALFASSTSDAKTMTTLMKLRKELDITQEQHRGWYEELKRHQQAGTLPMLLRQPVTAHGAAAAAPLQQAGMQAAQGAYGMQQQQQQQQRMYHQPISAVTGPYGQQQQQQQPLQTIQQQQQQQQQAQGHLQPLRQPSAVAAAPQQRPSAVATTAGQVRASGGSQSHGPAAPRPAAPGAGGAPKSQQKSQSKSKSKKKKKADSSDEEEVAPSMEDTVSDDGGDESEEESGGAGTSYGAYGGNGTYAANGGFGASGSGRPGSGAGGAKPRALGDPGKKKKKPKIDLASLPELIGVKVQRYWPQYQKWFPGVVTDWRERDGLYCITYNLGKKDESMEWFDCIKAESVGNPQMSYYQRTPEKIDLRRHAGTRAYQNSSVFHPNKSKKKTGGASTPGAGGGGGHHLGGHHGHHPGGYGGHGVGSSLAGSTQRKRPISAT